LIHLMNLARTAEVHIIVNVILNPNLIVVLA
jgi:hypothetical protein